MDHPTAADSRADNYRKDEPDDSIPSDAEDLAQKMLQVLDDYDQADHPTAADSRADVYRKGEPDDPIHSHAEDLAQQLLQVLDDCEEIATLISTCAPAVNFIPFLERVADASLSRILHYEIMQFSSVLIKKVCLAHPKNHTIASHVLRLLCNLSYTPEVLSVLVGLDYLNIVCSYMTLFAFFSPKK